MANTWVKVLISGRVLPSDILAGATSGKCLTGTDSSTWAWATKSNNSGTCTSVGITAGACIDVSGSPITTSGSMTVATDLSELGLGGTTLSGANDSLIYLDNGLQRQKPLNSCQLSAFSNDSGWTSNSGTVTSVSGGTGIDSTGGTTPSLTLDGTELTSHTFGDGSGTITINGNLTVSGTTTTVNSTVVTIKDNALELNSNSGSEYAQNVDCGIKVFGDATDNLVLGFDESEGRWCCAGGISTTALSTISGYLATTQQHNSSAPSSSDGGSGLGSFWLKGNVPGSVDLYCFTTDAVV